MSARMYDLVGQMEYLRSLLTDPDTDEEVVLGTMEAIDLEIEDKADGYAKIMKMLTGEANAIGAEIERLSARKKALENNVARLKENLEQAMVFLGKTKFKTDLFSFSIQKNPASVNITGDVPEQFMIPQEPKLDKKGLIAYIKEHGDTEYAQLTQGESLRIR